jgi:hypothetical protein
MTDLDELLERALPSIAAEIDPRPDLGDVRRRAASGSTFARRRVPWLAAAAAILVAVGITGVWLVTHEESAPPVDNVPAASSVDRSTTTTSTSTVPPTSPPTPPIENTQQPVVRMPTVVGVLDPALGLGDPTRDDPYDQWLHAGPDPDAQWLIHTDATGAPLAGIRITTLPSSEWSKSFDDGQPVDLGNPVEARIRTDGGRPTIGWRTDDGVRTVEGTGDADLDTLTTAATHVVASPPGADVALPGFTTIGAPIEDSTVTYASDASVTINRPGGTLPLDARSTLYLTVGNAQPAPGGWSADVGEATMFVADIDATTEVTIVWRRSVGLDPSTLLSSLRLTTPDAVAVQLRPNTPPADATYELGVASIGRWLLATWHDDAGGTCRTLVSSFTLETTFGLGRTECSLDGTLPPCIAASSWGTDVGIQFVLLTDDHVTNVTATAAGTPVPIRTIEHFNNHTLAVGTLPTDSITELNYKLDGTAAIC